MKKISLIVIGIAICSIGFSQTNFVWEKTDSVKKTKAQIYSETKMFIAKTWKSSKDVIQNDDKEGGLILIKGVVGSNIESYMFAKYQYTYQYNITFRIKENRFKITLDNVICISAKCITGNGQIWEKPKIEPFDDDNCPDINAFSGDGLPCKKMIPLMANVKERIQAIFDLCVSEISKPSNNSNW